MNHARTHIRYFNRLHVKLWFSETHVITNMPTRTRRIVVGRRRELPTRINCRLHAFVTIFAQKLDTLPPTIWGTLLHLLPPRLRPCTHSHTTHTQIHVQKCIENAIAVSHKLGVTNDHMSQFFGRCRFLLDCPRKLEWLQTPRKSDGYKRNGESEAQKLLFPFRKNQYFFALCLLLYSYKFSFVRKVSTLHPVADT